MQTLLTILRANKQQKIDCSKVHFEKALGVSCRIAKRANDLQ